MTAHPDLTPEQASITDEELVEKTIDHTPRPWGGPITNPDGTQVCRTCLLTWPCLPSRLIAALRAERSENDRLAKRLSRYEQVSGQEES